MMSSVTEANNTRDSARLASMWNEINLHLEERRRALAAEIRNYPTPIPRCDAQFNHLYEQQSRLARELDRVGALAGKNAKRKDRIEFIERFIASAPYADDPAERQLRSRLEAELSAVGK